MIHCLATSEFSRTGSILKKLDPVDTALVAHLTSLWVLGDYLGTTGFFNLVIDHTLAELRARPTAFPTDIIMKAIPRSTAIRRLLVDHTTKIKSLDYFDKYASQCHTISFSKSQELFIVGLWATAPTPCCKIVVTTTTILKELQSVIEQI